MKLHWEQTCCNSIDLLDCAGNVVGSIMTNGGENDITKAEESVAELICEAFNNTPESDDL